MATTPERLLQCSPLSAAQYRTMPESSQKVSLIDGVLVEEPSTSNEHQGIVNNLLLALLPFEKQARLGVVRTAPLDVWLTEDELVQPDVFFVSNARRSIIGKHIHGAPDLIIEILSPSTRNWDRTTKRERYARRGVQELWLVDPASRTIEIHRFAECFGGPICILSSGDEIQSPMLPELRLPVEKVFEL